MIALSSNFKNVVINAVTVALAELIAFNRIFYDALGLLLKVEGPSSPRYVTTSPSLLAISFVEV